VHLVDRIGLVSGFRTEQFADPTAPAGTTYHVVAYHQNGDFGAITEIRVAKP
jgi:hypothetical protein